MLLRVTSSQRTGEAYRWLACPAHIPGLPTHRPPGRPQELRTFFACGNVRSKGPASSVDVYTVHSTIQLEERVLPFFEENALRVKRYDFEQFAFIVRAIRARSHHHPEVFEDIVRRAYSMNARGRQRSRSIEEILLGSSETARKAPP